MASGAEAKVFAAKAAKILVQICETVAIAGVLFQTHPELVVCIEMLKNYMPSMEILRPTEQKHFTAETQ